VSRLDAPERPADDAIPPPGMESRREAASFPWRAPRKTAADILGIGPYCGEAAILTLTTIVANRPKV
jgi:hypothetical protein